MNDICKTKATMMTYSSIGNGLHILSLLNIALYGSMIYQFGSYGSGFFDESWLKHGFCIQHGDNHTTHDYSGHALSFISLLGLALQQCMAKQCSTTGIDITKADKLAFWAMVGALGHAWGHYFISFGIRKNFYPPGEMTFFGDLMESTVLEGIGKAVPGYPLFWIPLVGAYMHNTSKSRVAIVAVLCWLGSILMQVRFAFSYTQAVLFTGLSIDQLMLPEKEKGFEYALWPLMTTLPSGVLAWVEGTACTTSPLMQRHGHIIYDVIMSGSYIIFYLTCWFRANYAVKSKTL